MGNVFPPHNDIHEMYDLKGSTFGRYLPEEEIAKSKNAVMKDLNFEKNKKKLQMGPAKRKLFISQLVRDVKVNRVLRRKKGIINLYLSDPINLQVAGTHESHGLQFIDRRSLHGKRQ